MKIKVRAVRSFDVLRRFDAIFIVREDEYGNPVHIFRDGRWELVVKDTDNAPTFIVPAGLIPNFERINSED